MAKLEVAKAAYEKALKMKNENKAQEKIDAYNAWRISEEQKGRAQDEHGRNLVKIMVDSAKSATPRNLVNESMCNVMGNVDGKDIFVVYYISLNLSFVVFFFCGPRRPVYG